MIHGKQGQIRLHPDQQKRYLGTFKERVVLTVNLADCRQEDKRDCIALAFDKISRRYQSPVLKINGKLGNTLQVLFLQLAHKVGLKATVVDDKTGQSPYGLLVHIDRSEFCTNTDIRDLFPELWGAEETLQQVNKPTFWQRLFGIRRDRNGKMGRLPDRRE